MVVIMTMVILGKRKLNPQCAANANDDGQRASFGGTDPGGAAHGQKSLEVGHRLSQSLLVTKLSCEDFATGFAGSSARGDNPHLFSQVARGGFPGKAGRVRK